MRSSRSARLRPLTNATLPPNRRLTFASSDGKSACTFIECGVGAMSTKVPSKSRKSAQSSLGAGAFQVDIIVQADQQTIGFGNPCSELGF